MDEWNGDWDSWDEWLIERTQKAWDEFDAWVDQQKAERDKEWDRYLKRRKRNGSNRTGQSG
jgi:hypothetical protein